MLIIIFLNTAAARLIASIICTVKPRPPGAMQLRTRGHDYELPIIKYELNKQNFIVQSLFNYYDFVFYCIIFILYFIVHMCKCHMY